MKEDSVRKGERAGRENREGGEKGPKCQYGCLFRTSWKFGVGCEGGGKRVWGGH